MANVRDVDGCGPRIATNITRFAASRAWRAKLSAAICGPQPFVEPAGLVVLGYDPQVQTAVAVVRATPPRHLGYQTCSRSSPAPLAPAGHVLQQLAPLPGLQPV